jgi:hypothetical protein
MTATATGAATPPTQKKAPPTPSSSVDRGTSTRGETTTTTTSTPPHPIQIQDVLESFVGVLSTAVNHLQEGLAAPSPKNPRVSIPVAAAAAKPEANGEESAKAPKKPERDVVDTPAHVEDSKPAAAAKETNEEEKEGSETKDTDSEEENEEDIRPFIHGRHTCDSCLATPIIGKRYHSTNVSIESLGLFYIIIFNYGLLRDCFTHLVSPRCMLFFLSIHTASRLRSL